MQVVDKRKARTEREEERISKAFEVSERHKTGRVTIRWIGIVALGGFAFLSIDSIAGKTTAISVMVEALADLKVSLSIALTGLAIAWAAIERYLRHRKTEQLQGRIKELEQRLDPKRTSSGLTPRGSTNPRDIER